MEIAAQLLSLPDSESSAPILLASITNPDKARELFSNRRPAGAIANSLFDKGDHYQKSKGYIGAKPLAGTAGYSQTMAQIEAGFVSENVIKEVVDRHISGVLGREPLWGFLPFDAPSPEAEKRRSRFSKLFNIVRTTIQKATGSSEDKLAQEADEALTSAWWNTKKVRKTVKKAVRTALLEERVVIRFFFPNGLIAANGGQIPIQRDLANALTIPQLDVLTADKAGVFVDDDTQQEFGVHIYKVGEESAASLTYVENGLTILKIMVDKQADQLYSFELGGRLLMYEIQRDALITEQIRSLQKSLNLTRTMMVRNINLAGSLERTIMNAERPTVKTRITDPTEAAGYREEIKESDYHVGSGATMFLTGMLVRNDSGEIINRANPNISFRDPVETDTFINTRDDLYAAMLSGSFQRFALISGDATAAGRSRVEARAEFASSLGDSKDPIDDLGRWLLETELRLGALICNRTKDFLPLRCDFNAIVETGPITPEERKANRADVAVGLLSKETAMSENGIDDTDAELARIQEDPPKPIQNLPPGPTGAGAGAIG